ncbi:MAG: hypothetical protein R2867_27940 [Caldilineaceae bacterium]
MARGEQLAHQLLPDLILMDIEMPKSWRRDRHQSDRSGPARDQNCHVDGHSTETLSPSNMALSGYLLKNL